MPFLGFGEHRLDPDLSLADGFLVRLRRVVAADLLQIIDIERALDLAAMIAGGALGLHRAGVADTCLAAVRHHTLRAFGRIAAEGMSLRATIFITLGIEGEVILPIEIGAVRKVGQRYVGPDAGVLDGDDVLGGAVLGITRDVVGPDLPAEADAP